ncbi:MAG: thioether cross-link-forming SCIFF peptide maturase [Clostridia bacterium]|nr:thioether cross-link-forming SCIFF peptide maturase [Clostridia bacterium]
MIHLFRQNGFNICLDINSGTIHLPDDTAYDILSRCPAPADYEKLKNTDKYMAGNAEYDQAYSEIDQLIGEGSLFSSIDIPEIDGDDSEVVLKAMCLHMAHACNLRCDYCFAGDGEYSGGRKLMPFDVAKKAVDLLLSKSGAKRNVEIDFFGGEPMLNFDVVRQTVAYALGEQDKHGKQVHFTITTNGTILDDESCGFINEHMDNVVLSLDGRKEVHDRFRKYPGGRGSYDDILPNIKKIVEGRKDKSYFIRGTFTRENLDFAKDIRHLASLGFTDISIEPVTGGEFEMNDDEIAAAKEEYERFSVEYAAQSDYNFYHFKISLYNSPCIFKRINACGAGFEYAAVTPDGEIYACHRLAGEESFRMGTVFEGKLSRELAGRMQRNNVTTIAKCRDCWARYFCSGGCPATAYFANGSISMPDDKACELQKKRIECALAVEAARAMKGGNDE